MEVLRLGAGGKQATANQLTAAGSAPLSEPWSSNGYQVYSEEGAGNVI